MSTNNERQSRAPIFDQQSLLFLLISVSTNAVISHVLVQLAGAGRKPRAVQINPASTQRGVWRRIAASANVCEARCQPERNGSVPGVKANFTHGDYHLRMLSPAVNELSDYYFLKISLNRSQVRLSHMSWSYWPTEEDLTSNLATLRVILGSCSNALVIYKRI